MRQLVTTVIACSFAISVGAQSPERTDAATVSGFYGGVSLRNAGERGQGIALGPVSSAWSRYALPVSDDSGSRTLAYGGYRFGNDIALEAAVSTLDRYSLTPAVPGARRGVGLSLVQENDSPGKAWNVDVYTSWEFRRSLALYGRMGYAQSDVQPAPVASFTSDVRRARDGVNYGLGLRYDLTQALGLRVEYARFARLPGEVVPGSLPESDQLQLGLQFRF